MTSKKRSKRSKRSKRKKRDARKRKSPKRRSHSLDWSPQYKEIQLKPLVPNPRTKREKMFYALGIMAKLSEQAKKDYAKYRATKEFFNPY